MARNVYIYSFSDFVWEVFEGIVVPFVLAFGIGALLGTVWALVVNVASNGRLF